MRGLSMPGPAGARAGWITRPARVVGGMLCFLLSTTATALPGPPSGGDPEPVPLRIIAPVHQHIYQPSPRSATLLAPGEVRFGVNLSESNALHTNEEPGRFDTEVDLELTRLELGVEMGLTERWDVALELPLLYMHNGWMDHLIEEGESLVGKIKPRRRDELQDRFTYRAALDGVAFLEGQVHEIAPGDLALTLRRRLGEGDGSPRVAVLAGLELPTGVFRDGFGSGEVEVAVGATADWLFERFTVSAGTALTASLGEVEGTPNLATIPVLSGWGELTVPFGPRLAGHVQVAGMTPPFDLDETRVRKPNGETYTFTSHILQVTPALSWRFPSGLRLYTGIVEDFGSSEDGASDITLFTTLKLPARLLGGSMR